MPSGSKHEKTVTGAARGRRGEKRNPTAIDIPLNEVEPVYLTLQQVRANFTQICNGERPILVGNQWSPRAMVIPVGPSRYLSSMESKELLKRMEKAFAALRELLG